MVEVIENKKKLVIKLSRSLSTASSYAELISEKTSVDVKKIKTQRDMNVMENVYEIIPTDNNAKIIIMIKDDNDINLSYHIDFMIFEYNKEKWLLEYKPNPNYH